MIKRAATSSRALRVLVLPLATIQAGCTYYRPIEPIEPFNLYENAVVVRNGKRLTGEQLDIKSRNQIPIIDKVNVGFSWLSGPIEIPPCKMGVYINDVEKNRFTTINGKLMLEYVSEVPGPRYGKRFTTGTNNFVYGTDSRTGAFKGYHPLCSVRFRDIWAGSGVFFISPDPKRGTDEWTANAEAIKINNRTWLRQKFPIKNAQEAHESGSDILERWVLKIPETEYWLMINVFGSTEFRPGLPGVNLNPAKFARLLELVHQMVESVIIEPIDSNGNLRNPSSPSSPSFRRLNG